MTKQTTQGAARDVHHPSVPQFVEDAITTAAGIGVRALDLLPTQTLRMLTGAPIDLHLEAADFDMQTVERRM